jgi:type IV secretion system protein VirD4
MPRDDYRSWSPWDRPEPPPVDGPGDQLLGYGLLTAGIGSGLVWTTGQLAGLAFGHTWLHVDPADLASVFVHLPHYWNDPALAWPGAARRALPGPVGMYGTFAATTAAAATATGQVMRLLGNHERPEVGRAGRRTGRKSSTWAKPRELRALFVDKPEPGRLILGRTGGLHRRLLATEDCHSVLIYGPPGSHKTAGVVIPDILEWYGPLVSTSVKPDVLEATLQDRRRKGEVWVYDPLGALGIRSAQWTPLATCGTWNGALTTAHFLAQSAEMGTTQSADHQYWTRAGVKFLAPMLLAAARSDRTMAEVLRWVNLREGADPEREDEIAKILHELGEDAAGEAWAASMFASDRRLDSLYATAEDLLTVYQDERVAASTEGYDVDPAALLAGNNTLYLYAPPHEQKRLRPLFETLTSQVVRVAQEKAARSPWGTLDPRLLLALDEAGNVAALADLPELATTGRGQGIQILSVWHDEAQLRRRYGEAAPTVVNGHRAKLFLSGLADVGALESGSKLIGDEAVVELNPSVDQQGRRSYGQSTTWRPLVAPDELRRLQPREGIVIYGHHKPVKVRLRPWFERREQARLQRGQWRALRARERAERRADKAAAASEVRAQARARRLLGDSEREAHDGRG